MNTYELVPRRGGYYAEVGDRIDPTLAQDLNYLMSGDDYAMERAHGGYTLRGEVLITRVDQLEAQSS